MTSISPAATPLEDELGDILEKALRRAGWKTDDLAEESGVETSKIRDAMDYRSDLTASELNRLASALKLNEVGLAAVAAGRYPLPDTTGLPFPVWPLRMPHGIGVANAYLIGVERAVPSFAKATEGGPDALSPRPAKPTRTKTGILFDTGAGMAALEAAWPAAVKKVSAVFLTHGETEHSGGLCEVVERFGGPPAYVPEGSDAPCGTEAGEGETFRFGALEVVVFRTPGHASAHNCYWVRMAGAPDVRSLLISGDLVFAGSAGGGYFCCRQNQTHLCRVFDALPASAVIAPGHGPMTTIGNERRFNPFLA